MPTWRALLHEWPHSVLRASEDAVGLPPGQMGNSEVGHLNLGAGRPVLQDLPRIDAAIADGSFFDRVALLEACRRAARPGGRLHIISLIGPGGVHANDRHLVAIADLAAAQRRPRGPRPRAARRARHAAPIRDRVRRRRREAPRGRPFGRTHRVDRRALLRDGSRQPLGPGRAWVRRDRPRCRRARAGRDRGDRGRLRARRERRIPGPDGDRRRRRHGAQRGPADPCQLPCGSGAPARPRPGRRRLRGVRPLVAQRPARPDRPVRGDDDRIRGRAPCRRRLPARGGTLARAGLLGGRLEPVPRGGDREIRPRDLLLQRWRRGALPRGGAAPRSEPSASRPTTWSRR